jgi:hypothetical protein
MPVQMTLENESVRLRLVPAATVSGGGPTNFAGKLSADGNQIVGSFADERIAQGQNGPTPKVMARITLEGCIARQVRQAPQN